MNELTTISWMSLLIGVGLLFIIWILTSKTRYGRLIVTRETPWNVRQWTTILVIIAITMFILVNPVFHLLTTGIFAVLYYVFVNKNILGRKISHLGNGKESLRGGIDFGAKAPFTLELHCKGIDFSGQLAERKALDKCLFSFLTVSSNPFPEVDHIDGVYHVKGELSSKKYYSSLIQYIQRAGFEIEIKNTK